MIGQKVVALKNVAFSDLFNLRALKPVLAMAMNAVLLLL